MQQRLIIESDLTHSELEQKISKGSRFITYQYCVSIFFAVTLQRFSPAILIDKDEDLSKYRKRYNAISLIFGWWGIPWGPIYTLKSISVNKKGGIDITENVMLNMTEEGLAQREIELSKTEEFFCKPNKSDLKAFNKAFCKQCERDYNIKHLAVGLFINTEEGERPYYTIGLKVENHFDDYIEPLKKSLYKYFMKHICFEFINLNEDIEEYRFFEKQSVVIINRANTL